MGKRLWFFLVAAPVLGLLVGACGSGELAPELTPIPTLAPGETPALVGALTEGAAPATEEAPEGEEGDLVAAGEALFEQACAGCHGAQDGAGPALTGMADRAATRVEGMSAEEYLHESIVDPSAHVVEGFQDIMPKQYGEEYTDEQIESLIAYIMHAGSTGAAAGEEAAAPDPELGAELFAANCAGCHGAQDGAGPALPGMGERAATRVEGMSAEEYLHESIVDPSAHVVEGFQDIMPKGYGDRFTDHELDSMVTYILEQ